MAHRKHGAPPPPTESEVRHQDWYGRDMSGERHVRVAFVDVDLTEAVAAGASFDECTFRDCRFNASQHTDTAFVNCTFVGCSFFEAVFTRCKLVGSMFDRCSFGLITVDGGDWSFAGLPGADLRKCRFTDVRLREADLTGARLTNAAVRDTDLSGAWLHSADLTGADLRGSDLSSVDPMATPLKGAIIDVEQAVVLATTLGVQVRPDR